MLHGKHEEALQSLARLRLCTPEEAKTDGLIQVGTFFSVLGFLLDSMAKMPSWIDRTFGDEGGDDARSKKPSSWGEERVHVLGGTRMVTPVRAQVYRPDTYWDSDHGFPTYFHVSVPFQAM